MTVSARSLFLPRPAPGRRGGRRRATGQPGTGGQHRNGRSAAEDRGPHAIVVFEPWRYAVAARPFGAIRERRPPRRRWQDNKQAPAACGRLRQSSPRRCSSTRLSVISTVLALCASGVRAPKGCWLANHAAVMRGRRQGSKPKAETAAAGSVYESPARTRYASARRPIRTAAAELLFSGPGLRDTPPIPAWPAGPSW
jgi:hypothetical protein